MRDIDTIVGFILGACFAGLLAMQCFWVMDTKIARRDRQRLIDLKEEQNRRMTALEEELRLKREREEQAKTLIKIDNPEQAYAAAQHQTKREGKQ